MHTCQYAIVYYVFTLKEAQRNKNKRGFKNFFIFVAKHHFVIFVSLHSAEASELLDHWISDSLIICLPVCLTENNAFIKIEQIHKYTNTNTQMHLSSCLSYTNNIKFYGNVYLYWTPYWVPSDANKIKSVCFF